MALHMFKFCLNLEILKAHSRGALYFLIVRGTLCSLPGDERLQALETVLIALRSFLS
jgi:hypothetical protein